MAKVDGNAKPVLDRVKSEDDKWRRYAITALSRAPEGTAEDVAAYAAGVADAMLAHERERCTLGDGERAGKPTLSQKLDQWFADRDAQNPTFTWLSAEPKK